MTDQPATSEARSADRQPAADWYDHPRYYDAVFDCDTPVEADFLETMARRHLRTRRAAAGTGGDTCPTRLRVLEPACGSGRLLLELARRGHRVAGFDLNPHMLAYARERLARENVTARIWQADLAGFEPPRPRCHLAFCLVSTFKYLLTESAALDHLRRVADSLQTGGLYVLGLHLTDYTHRRPCHERWVSDKPGLNVVCNTRTWPACPRQRLEAVRSRLRITETTAGGSGAVVRRREIETRWTFRSYNARQLAALLRAVPAFELVVVHDFHYDPAWTTTIDGGQWDLVLVLRKRRRQGDRDGT